MFLTEVRSSHDQSKAALRLFVPPEFQKEKEKLGRRDKPQDRADAICMLLDGCWFKSGSRGLRGGRNHLLPPPIGRK